MRTEFEGKISLFLEKNGKPLSLMAFLLWSSGCPESGTRSFLSFLIFIRDRDICAAIEFLRSVSHFLVVVLVVQRSLFGD